MDTLLGQRKCKNKLFSKNLQFNIDRQHMRPHLPLENVITVWEQWHWKLSPYLDVRGLKITQVSLKEPVPEEIKIFKKINIHLAQREQVFTVQKHAFSELKNKATGTEIPRKRTHFGALRSVRRVAICSPLYAITGVQEENVCSLARSPCKATSHPHPGWAESNCSLRADVRLLRHILEQLGLTVIQRVSEDTLFMCVWVGRGKCLVSTE